MTIKKKLQPKTVRKVACVKCKELLLKVYPWAIFSQPNIQVGCGKCSSKV